MYGQVHANRVFYRNAPRPGHRYRQIALHELNSFIVIVGDGDVVHEVPQFQVNNPDAEALIFDNLRDALNEVESECRRAEEDGLFPYEPGM
jgi:hypothetical protein